VLRKKRWLLSLAVFVAFTACSGGQETTGDTENADVVEIEYWQYHFDAKVELMDELIKAFEAENPGHPRQANHVPLRAV